MPTNRLAYTKTPASQPASGGVAYKANSYNCSNATSKVVSLNGTWKTDSISFTVDPLYRYTVHVRNSASIGATSINIDFIEVYGEASASYLTCSEDSGGYRFGYMSAERDDELKGSGNSLNFTLRMYDPRLGRFFAPDPYESEYPSFSTYSFVGNSPIMNVEVDGGWWFSKSTNNQSQVNHNSGQRTVIPGASEYAFKMSNVRAVSAKQNLFA